MAEKVLSTKLFIIGIRSVKENPIVCCFSALFVVVITRRKDSRLENNADSRLRFYKTAPRTALSSPLKLKLLATELA